MEAWMIWADLLKATRSFLVELDSHVPCLFPTAGDKVGVEHDMMKRCYLLCKRSVRWHRETYVYSSINSFLSVWLLQCRVFHPYWEMPLCVCVCVWNTVWACVDSTVPPWDFVPKLHCLSVLYPCSYRVESLPVGVSVSTLIHRAGASEDRPSPPTGPAAAQKSSPDKLWWLLSFSVRHFSEFTQRWLESSRFPFITSAWPKLVILFFTFRKSTKDEEDIGCMVRTEETSFWKRMTVFLLCRWRCRGVWPWTLRQIFPQFTGNIIHTEREEIILTTEFAEVVKCINSKYCSSTTDVWRS